MVGERPLKVGARRVVLTWKLGAPQTPVKGRMGCWATGVVGKAAKVGTKVGHTPD